MIGLVGSYLAVPLWVRVIPTHARGFPDCGSRARSVRYGLVVVIAAGRMAREPVMSPTGECP